MNHKHVMTVATSTASKPGTATNPRSRSRAVPKRGRPSTRGLSSSRATSAGVKNTSSRWIPTEAQEQEILFRWAKLSTRKYPQLALMYAIPNGGWRHKLTAVKMKREGVKPGVPDICLPVARAGFNSLYIELKRKTGGKLSTEQKTFLSGLNDNGNLAVVCKGWEEARVLIEAYLGESR